jgi:hypothetical protein
VFSGEYCESLPAACGPTWRRSRRVSAGHRERRRAAVGPRLGSRPEHTRRIVLPRCVCAACGASRWKRPSASRAPGDIAAREPRARGTGRVGGGWSADQWCVRGRGQAQAEHREERTEHERPPGATAPHAVPCFPMRGPCATAASGPTPAARPVSHATSTGPAISVRRQESELAGCCMAAQSRAGPGSPRNDSGADQPCAWASPSAGAQARGSGPATVPDRVSRETAGLQLYGDYVRRVIDHPVIASRRTRDAGADSARRPRRRRAQLAAAQANAIRAAQPVTAHLRGVGPVRASER